MTDWLLTLLQTVATQLIGVLGIFFVFGYILSKLETWTLLAYRRSIGWNGILWTAWLGTPIHEIGHMVFCKLFRHRIERFSLFGPNEITGDLGYVDHSFNRFSLYQRIGNFFIGAAPLIFGSGFLVLLLYLLVPGGKEAFVPLAHTMTSFGQGVSALESTLTHLFSWENLRAWNFWLFLYVSFCIVSHMAPSKRDRGNMWSGLVWIVLILIIVNSIALLLNHDVTQRILGMNQYLGIILGMSMYALLLSSIHLVLATIILLPFRKR